MHIFVVLKILAMRDLFNSIIQGENAFHINFWVKVLAFILYSDLFFFVVKIPIFSTSLDLIILSMNIAYIVLFILGAIVTIGIITCVIALMEYVYITYLKCVSSNTSQIEIFKVSARLLKDYAILKNNQIAYAEALRCENSFIDNRIQIGVLILLALDVLYGGLANLIQLYYPDDSSIVCKIISLVILLGIMMVRITLLDKSDNIYVSSVFSKKCHEEVFSSWPKNKPSKV